jgi:hypothetical protein
MNFIYRKLRYVITTNISVYRYYPIRDLPHPLLFILNLKDVFLDDMYRRTIILNSNRVFNLSLSEKNCTHIRNSSYIFMWFQLYIHTCVCVCVCVCVVFMLLCMCRACERVH